MKTSTTGALAVSCALALTGSGWNTRCPAQEPAVTAPAPAAAAAAPAGKPTASSGGFESIARVYASGEERKAQPDLWVFELQFKSLRMLELELTDPRTGTKNKEIVMYLVYRAVLRELERAAGDVERTPVNAYDVDPVPDLFIPQITLVTNDNAVRSVVHDSVIPEAQRAIERRERMRLLNPVEIVQKVPTPVKADDPGSNALHGVAIFRGVDPDTDRFTLFMTGFSNGYKLVKGPVSYADLGQLASGGMLKPGDQIWNGDLTKEWAGAATVGNLFRTNGVVPDGADAQQWFYTMTPDRADDTVTVWRKTLVQKYWRPGDRFDQNEQEIRQDGEVRWIYRPDDAAAQDATAPVEATAARIDTSPK